MFSLRRVLMAGAAVLGLASNAHADNDLRHVLLISVDGMHEVDLRLWVQGHPKGALAQLFLRSVTKVLECLLTHSRPAQNFFHLLLGHPSANLFP